MMRHDTQPERETDFEDSPAVPADEPPRDWRELGRQILAEARRRTAQDLRMAPNALLNQNPPSIGGTPANASAALTPPARFAEARP